jgi:arsenate reductase (thioredoxin)
MAPDSSGAANQPLPRRVLFVCIGNSCRSQMAEALARSLAADVIEPSSAGLSPLGIIAAPTRQVLLERGVSIDGQHSKGFSETSLTSADLIINMTGIPGPALFGTLHANVVDWEIDDPYGEEIAVYQQVCDEIEEKIRELAQTLRKNRQE